MINIKNQIQFKFKVLKICGEQKKKPYSIRIDVRKIRRNKPERQKNKAPLRSSYSSKRTLVTLQKGNIIE